MTNYTNLYEYALTDAQRHVIGLVIEHDGNVQKAAHKAGRNERGMRRTIARVQRYAARKGYDPAHDATHPVPEGQVLRGQSTLYRRGEPEPVLQWVKTAADRESQLEILRQAAESIMETIPSATPIPAPDTIHKELMSVYPVFDAHLGMYSWAAETGADFDLKIAEQDLMAAVDYLVSQSPASQRGLLINGGDYFHAENMQGITEKSGNILDMDTRFYMMIDVGMHLMQRMIARMLEKHQTVEVVNIPGNHDETMAHVMSVFCQSLYANEPRVYVHASPSERRYIQHGQTMIGVTHGHKTKDRDLPLIAATEQPRMWADTRHRYVYRGHDHHDERVEFNGAIVEHFRKLSAADAHEVGRGYLTGRDLKCIVHHTDAGEHVRFTCGIDVVRRLQG